MGPPSGQANLRSGSQGAWFGPSASLASRSHDGSSIVAKAESQSQRDHTSRGLYCGGMLDRETFNHVVRDAAVKKREKYDAFLKSVTLISSLGAYERSQIADALELVFFKVRSIRC